MKRCILNLETTKIELHFDKSDYMALPEETKKKLRSLFLWSNMGGCWVSRCKEPNLYWARQFAKELNFPEEEREGERLNYEEQLNKKSERAENRIDKFNTYANNAEKRGDAKTGCLESFRGDIAFFTQPNINSSGGRRFTNMRNKLYARYDSGMEEYRKSEYFKTKAAASMDTVTMPKLKDKGYLDRKIKECKKSINKYQGYIVDCEDKIYRIEKGETIKRYDQTVITIEDLEKGIESYLEQIEILIDKQCFFENKLDELGGVTYSKENIKPGFIVVIDHFIGEVIGTGSVNITYKTEHGSILTATYAEIKKIIKTDEKKKEVHPFEVGEEYSIKRYDLRKKWGDEVPVHIFKIIARSDATIKLQNQTMSEEKPIIRKPTNRSYNEKWYWAYDDSSSNTFWKERTAI